MFVEPTVHSRFESICERFGAKTAIRDRYERISYEALNARANALAGTLLRTYPAAQYVTLMLEQGILHTAVMLAVSKAGKVFVPLNEDIPCETVLQCMRQCGSSLLVTSEARRQVFAERLDSPAIWCPVLDDVDPVNPGVAGNGDDEFVIFHTSGSTGVPKGVVHTQQSALFFVANYSRLYGLEANDVHSMLYPSGFYGGLRDCLVPLLGGCTLARYSFTRDFDAPLEEWIRTEKVTILSCPVKSYRDLAKSVRDKRNLRTVRMVRPGGDASCRQDFDLFKQHFSPGCKFFAGFASSETGLARYNVLSTADQVDSDIIPAGWPVEGVESYLVDEAGNRIVDEGTRGIIVFESPHLFRGYRNQAAETAKVLDLAGPVPRFVSNDFGVIRHGQLHFDGRRDFHVKINGVRVDLNEISLHAMRLPGVANAATVYHEQRELVYLFYEVSAGPVLDEQAVMRWLADHLPYYQLPKRCIKMSSLPVTPNAKIDRAALISEVEALVNSARTTEFNTSGAVLAQIWKEQLQLDAVRPEDNFFELGGNSLLAIAVETAIEQRLGIRVEPYVLYQYPTIVGLCDFFDRADDAYPDQR